MNKEEIENRIEICEERANAYREVGNVKISNKYENEKYKWEKLLNQLNPKMEKELNEYRRGYYKQKEVIDKAIEYINKHDDGCYTDITCKCKVAELNITKLLDILKEVK